MFIRFDGLLKMAVLGIVPMLATNIVVEGLGVLVLVLVQFIFVVVTLVNWLFGEVLFPFEDLALRFELFTFN